jgi:hypothetical protein
LLLLLLVCGQGVRKLIRGAGQKIQGKGQVGRAEASSRWQYA